MKKKQIIIPGILLVIIIGAYFSIIGCKSFVKTIESNLNQLTDQKILNFDISGVPDGTYSGSYKVFPIIAKVEVTINNHEITEIKLIKHRSGRGAPAEIITEKVVGAQTLEVDVVSGATYSSKVILKAVEDALNNAR